MTPYPQFDPLAYLPMMNMMTQMMNMQAWGQLNSNNPPSSNISRYQRHHQSNRQRRFSHRCRQHHQQRNRRKLRYNNHQCDEKSVRLKAQGVDIHVS